MRQILREILSLNENVQTAGVIDTQEYTLTSFRSKNAKLTEKEEENFTLRQLKIVGMQKVYDDNFGKIQSSFIFHEKANLLFFNIKKYIFFIICEKNHNRNDFFNLIDKFEKILINSTNPKLAKTKHVQKMCEECSRTKCLRGCMCPCHNKLIHKIAWNIDYF